MEEIGQLDDLDYIRSLLEVDRELAIKTIPSLRMPKVGYYFLKSDSEDIVLSSASCRREELIEILLENKINVVGLM